MWSRLTRNAFLKFVFQTIAASLLRRISHDKESLCDPPLTQGRCRSLLKAEQFGNLLRRHLARLLKER